MKNAILAIAGMVLCFISTLSGQPEPLHRDTDKKIEAKAHSIGVLTKPGSVKDWYSSISNIDTKWSKGEVWKRRDDLSEGDISLTPRFIDVQFKPATNRKGVDHFVYEIPNESEASVTYLPLLGVIRSTAVGGDNDPFYEMEVGQYEFVDLVNQGDVLRIKVVYRFREDGKLAFRYLHQDQAKTWHLDYKVVYENTGNPYKDSRLDKYKCSGCIKESGPDKGTEVSTKLTDNLKNELNIESKTSRKYEGEGVVLNETETAKTKETKLPAVEKVPID